MKYPQWERALRMVELMRQIESEGESVIENRNYIQSKIEQEFNLCHGCLLLAVYGFYKNGYIKDTKPQKKANIDYTGFDGNSSQNIKHAFEALDLLKNNPYLFSPEDGELEKELNKCIIPESLKNEFRKKSIQLSKTTTITKESEDKWMITNEEKKNRYLIRKEEGKLNIYNKPNLTASAIKRELGGEASIYTFIIYFYNNGLLK